MRRRVGVRGRAALALACLVGLGAVIFVIAGNDGETDKAPIFGFGKGRLIGESSMSPTSLQFGPDGRLYVAQFDGAIKAYRIARRSASTYEVTETETIELIRHVPNHNDRGEPDPEVDFRLITGMLVAGSRKRPVIYVSHSDPRIGGDIAGTDLDLDTNSGMVSRVTKTAAGWRKLDLVRGLSRSEENHATNGMALDRKRNVLYLAAGGNTNAGAPSKYLAGLSEFALSAAVLSIDLSAIGNRTLDLPTLDDEDRPGSDDAGDPFGGNDGKNQAMLVRGGPVQVFASGFRNPFDLVLTRDGRLYTIDNGGNAGWGAPPDPEGPDGACTNEPRAGGRTDPDQLLLVSKGFYGGHPNPTRANPANKFNRSNPQSPVFASNPVECDYRKPGSDESEAQATFPASTNGLAEYTASNFGGELKGDLLAAGWSANGINRMKRDPASGEVTRTDTLFSEVGANPLDVTATGDRGPFPGTIWVADQGDDQIYVFEPSDFGGARSSCTGRDDGSLDEDRDGFSNSAEIANETNPCSGGDRPPDHDRDHRPDRTDPDDDNDRIADLEDPFALDPENGRTTKIPLEYSWENDAPPAGGILDLGFTGLMTNGDDHWLDQFDRSKITARGAAGVFTVDQVDDGDAYEGGNDQLYGLQFGIDARPRSADRFTVSTRVLLPFPGLIPQGDQSAGLFVGNGTQDDYSKVVVTANDGDAGIEALQEQQGRKVGGQKLAVRGVRGADFVDLFITVDPDTGTLQSGYRVSSKGRVGPRRIVGPRQKVPAQWLQGRRFGLAVGIISTSIGPAPVFPATWDFVRVQRDRSEQAGSWTAGRPMLAPMAEVAAGAIDGAIYVVGAGDDRTAAYDLQTESWQVDGLPQRQFRGDHHAAEVVDGKLYLFGGLGPAAGKVQIYDPQRRRWGRGADIPFATGSASTALIDGKVYLAGGIVGEHTTRRAAVYDPKANSWRTIAPMPAGRNHTAAATDGRRLYVVGGRGPGSGDANMTANGFDTLQVYDPRSNTWSSSADPGSGLPPLPQARGGMGKGVFWRGELYVFGGETFDGAGATLRGVYDRVDIFNPRTKRWRSGAPMPIARHGIFPVPAGRTIHVIGGGARADASASAVHEVYRPDRPR